MDHPLPTVVRDLVGLTRDRYVELLAANVAAGGSREPRDDRFVAKATGSEPVLLIDDTWTSGGHAQSAAAALRLAGWGPVGIVAIGRHFNLEPARADYRDAAATYVEVARAHGWDWRYCCLCDER